GTLIASAFRAGLVDKVLAFVAPKIVGGLEAPTPVEGIGLPKMSEAISLSFYALEQVGEDVLLVAYPKQDEGAV
ncbi:MAG: dihydrofolate reductase family protein, partial [Chloroflexi bacterium]|nr:dihydrofolate reductase family protein [Chloroflexota bacterium]